MGQAARTLAETELDAQLLDDAQTAVLLRLLDLVLAARTPGSAHSPVAAAAYGIRLQVTPKPGTFTTVKTQRGRIHIDGYALTITRAEHTRAEL